MSPAAQVLDPVQVAQRRQRPHRDAGAGRKECAITPAGRQELTPLAPHTDLERGPRNPTRMRFLEMAQPYIVINRRAPDDCEPMDAGIEMIGPYL